jgi:hypothetical protein
MFQHSAFQPTSFQTRLKFVFRVGFATAEVQWIPHRFKNNITVTVKIDETYFTRSIDNIKKEYHIVLDNLEIIKHEIQISMDSFVKTINTIKITLLGGKNVRS